MLRILIISHNIISDYGNMGKTIKSFFESNSEKISLSQIYLSEELPMDKICNFYFQITDKIVLKNLFSIKEIGNEIKLLNKTITRTNSNNRVRKKGYMLRFIRDLVWKINYRKKDEII